MSTPSAPRPRRTPLPPPTLERFAAAVGPHSIDTLRGFFLALIGDLAEPNRRLLRERIDSARRINDFWHLRAALFDAISRDHGEQVARDRLDDFDARWQ